MNAFAHYHSHNEPIMEEKIYVQPDHVVLHENQIWADVGRGWFHARNLSTDATGFYVSGVYSDPEDVSPGTWLCGYCGRINPIWKKKCQNPDCPTNK